MTLCEKSAYLKGLMEGMQLSTESNEGKMIAALVDLVADMATTVKNLEDNAIAVSDELDEIEEALDEIEDILYDELDDEDDDDDDIYDFSDDDDDYDFDEENPEYEVTCPKCGEVLILAEDALLDGEIDCPKCGENLEFEFDEIEE